jgi:hypothetical protein
MGGPRPRPGQAPPRGRGYGAPPYAGRGPAPAFAPGPYDQQQLPRGANTKAMRMMMDGPGGQGARPPYGYGYGAQGQGQEQYYGEGGEGEEEEAEKELYRSQPEMDDMLKTFNEMRLDCQLCDTTFCVRGVTFPAHRVVLCSSSRWFRALLSTKDDSAPITVDQLEPKAFELVLGYIYGERVEASVDVSVCVAQDRTRVVRS